MHWAWILWATLAVPGQADTAVVCPEAYRQALAPWLAYRQAQGRRIALIDHQGSAEQIRAAIRQVAHAGKLKAVMLVGDAPPTNAPPTNAPPTNVRAASTAARTIPVHWAPAKVNVRWGSEPEIATDNWYADLDDDLTPDVALGRLTVDSAAELSLIVRKILDYEREQGADLWRRRIHLIAGLGGFGQLADAALEAAAKSILTEGIPASYASSMTYASWRSPYCPDPARFNQTTIDRLNDGCLFWVYMGHGQRREVDRLYAPGGAHRILDCDDMTRLQARRGAPIALFLACYTGAFDAEDCLAEEMLRTEGGPVAVICGSRVTMPYAMSVLGTEMLKECFHQKRETIGEVLLYAKRNSVLNPRTDPRSKTLDSLASLLNPKGAELAEERAEHLLLFNLLGDPLLRLRHPRELKLQVSPTVAAGQRLLVSGTSQVDGEALVELVVRRDRMTFQPKSRGDYRPSPEMSAAFQETYSRANDARLGWQTALVANGRFAAELEVPSHAWGDCHVRVFVQGERDFAASSADVNVRRSERNER